jgi:mannose-6-phosphate isomerase
VVRPVRIEGARQRYDWGSTTAIPALLGCPPDGTPWAELWLGDHPTAPATVPDDGGAPLDAQLPFLLKILAAAAPLSLQAHPTREQAEAGYAREDAAGIPLDAPERTYRDRNHKPELLLALTPFDALYGFRRPEESAARLAGLDAAELAPAIDALQSGSLREAMVWLLDRSPDEAAALARAAARRDPLAAELADGYPGDIGVVVALLLNRVQLEPDEAIYLGPGTLHAYLGGMGVELMARSDNVIRGGLTSKHVDRAELLRVLVMAPSEPRIVGPERVDAITTTWRSPAEDFQLWRLEPAGEPHHVATRGPEVVLCVDGTAMLDDLTLTRGQAAFVPPSEEGYTVSGSATLYRATTA